MPTLPTVMVSSTFYDLQQVRTDLSVFLSNQLGFATLLSEHNSFPVDPSLDTVANCTRRVEQDADVLVLVVGGRYGSLDSRSQKSVTNLEYLAAIRKAIPVYVFVKKEILAVLPVWASNPDGDFAEVCDTPLLLRFVSELRDRSGKWVFPFETAQDIVATLRHQFAFLAKEGLDLRRLLGGGEVPHYLSSAPPTCARLALEQPPAWEYRLFGESLRHQVELRAGLIREYRSGLRVGRSEQVGREAAFDWMVARIHELRGGAQGTDTLLNEEAHLSFGEPGEHGDPEHILWVTAQIGRTLEHMLTWVHRVRTAHFPDEFAEVQGRLERLPSDMIEKLLEFPDLFMDQVDQAMEDLAADRPATIVAQLVFDAPDADDLVQALARLRERLGI